MQPGGLVAATHVREGVLLTEHAGEDDVYRHVLELPDGRQRVISVVTSRTAAFREHLELVRQSYARETV
jgi:hypothetical protein